MHTGCVIFQPLLLPMLGFARPSSQTLCQLQPWLLLRLVQVPLLQHLSGCHLALVIRLYVNATSSTAYAHGKDSIILSQP
jgi:hypothetical protein